LNPVVVAGRSQTVGLDDESGFVRNSHKTAQAISASGSVRGRGDHCAEATGRQPDQQNAARSLLDL